MYSEGTLMGLCPLVLPYSDVYRFRCPPCLCNAHTRMQLGSRSVDGFMLFCLCSGGNVRTMSSRLLASKPGCKWRIIWNIQKVGFALFYAHSSGQNWKINAFWWETQNITEVLFVRNTVNVRNCRFRKTTDKLKLYVSLCCHLTFLKIQFSPSLWSQRCAHALVWVSKTSWFDLK